MKTSPLAPANVLLTALSMSLVWLFAQWAASRISVRRLNGGPKITLKVGNLGNIGSV